VNSLVERFSLYLQSLRKPEFRRSQNKSSRCQPSAMLARGKRAAHSRLGFFQPSVSRVLFSFLPPVPTMASTSQWPKGRDGVLPTLDVFIQILNTAKDTCGIPPAQAAFGSASVFLALIRVGFLHPPCKGKPLTHVHIGHDGQRSGLRQPRAGLR
jgi:hypothetical protein